MIADIEAVLADITAQLAAQGTARLEFWAGSSWDAVQYNSDTGILELLPDATEQRCATPDEKGKRKKESQKGKEEEEE